NDVAGKGGSGFFRKFVEKKRVPGPTLGTRSQNYKAVGLMHAVPRVSRAATQPPWATRTTSTVALGATARRRTPKSDFVDMIPAGPPVEERLRAEPRGHEEFIADHVCVTGPEIGRVFASAVRFVR